MNDKVYDSVLYTRLCELEADDQPYELFQCEVSYVVKDGRHGLIQNNKFRPDGNIDYYANVILECDFDNLYPLNEEGQLIVCINSGKLGLYKLVADTSRRSAAVQAKCILSCEYDRIEPMFHNCAIMLVSSGVEKRWLKPDSCKLSEAFYSIEPLNWQYVICYNEAGRFLFDLYYEKCIYTIPAGWYCRYICEKGCGDVFLLTHPEDEYGAEFAQQLLICENQAESITLSPLANNISIHMMQGLVQPYLTRVELSFEDA